MALARNYVGWDTDSSALPTPDFATGDSSKHQFTRTSPLTTGDLVRIDSGARAGDVYKYVGSTIQPDYTSNQTVSLTAFNKDATDHQIVLIADNYTHDTSDADTDPNAKIGGLYKYVGSAEQWDKAEAACKAAAESLGMPYTAEKGEAAFYGPKIDFVVRDVIGREWQLGTVQVDYQLPQRFDLTYTGADNHPHRPVIIHRAPFGSMERFIGVLIEHFGGAFPLWLAPVQVAVLSISERFNDYANEVIDALKKAGLTFRNRLEAGPGGKQIQVEDPDGNPIELFEPAH